MDQSYVKHITWDWSIITVLICFLKVCLPYSEKGSVL